MKQFSSMLVLLFTALVCTSLAAPDSNGQAENSAVHAGKCYEAGTSTYYNVDDTWQTVGSCSQNICRKEGPNQDAITRTLACGLIAQPSKDCTVVLEDPSGIYPDCCTKAVCPEG